MSYVKNGTPIGGTALPTASGAGQVPVSTGAGSAYTATSAGDVVDAAIASVVGAVAGQAIVGDGLGGVTETSADVSAMLAAADAAAARSAISALGITRAVYDFASAAGITLTNGNGTAAVTGGQLVFTTASGADTTLPNRPNAIVALPATVDPWHFDASAQLVGATGTLGGAVNRVWFGFSNDVLGTNAVYGAAGALSVGIFTAPDGSLTATEVTTGGGGTRADRVTHGAGTLSFDGQDWLKIEVRGSSWAMYTGRGTSLPTTWTRRWGGVIGSTSLQGVAFTPMTYVYLSAYRNGAQAQVSVTTFDSLRITGAM